MIVVPVLLVPDVPVVQRAAVAAAMIAPFPTGLVVAVLALITVRRAGATRRTATGPEAGCLLSLVAAIQSGSTLRAALAGVSPEAGRLVAVGASTDDLAAAIGRALPEHGRMASAAVRLLDRAGGPAAPVMAELASQASDTSRVRRELRAAVAAPVLQGIFVGGAPLVVLIHLVFSGRFAEIVAVGPAHAVAVGGGTVMTLVGVAWVAAIVRRSMP